MQAINSLEDFGSTIILPGGVQIVVSGISSEEAFGLLLLRGADLYNWALQSGFIKTKEGGFPGSSSAGLRTTTGGFATTQD
jgi:hypothetical protein